MRAALAIVLAVSCFAGCSTPDEAETGDPRCAPEPSTCSAVAGCDPSVGMLACGYGRGEDGGYACGRWSTLTEDDCPAPYILCRAGSEAVACLRR